MIWQRRMSDTVQRMPIRRDRHGIHVGPHTDFRVWFRLRRVKSCVAGEVSSRRNRRRATVTPKYPSKFLGALRGMALHLTEAAFLLLTTAHQELA